MKTYILLISAFYTSSICLAQEPVSKDSIQIGYCVRADAIGGKDHRITLYSENGLMYCQRVCYTTQSMLDAINKYMPYEGHSLDEINPISYREARKHLILRHYQESNNYLIIDERVEISKSQFDELIKIINEIKMFAPKEKPKPDEIIISTATAHYLLKDNNGTTVIIDWLGRYNRSGDIEKALGLKNYSRCPCVEEDLKQMKKNRKKSFRRN